MSFKTFKQQNEEQDGSVLIKLLSDVIVERIGIKPNYNDEAIKDASIIFMDVVLDKMHDLQIEEVNHLHRMHIHGIFLILQYHLLYIQLIIQEQLQMTRLQPESLIIQEQLIIQEILKFMVL